MMTIVNTSLPKAAERGLRAGNAQGGQSGKSFGTIMEGNLSSAKPDSSNAPVKEPEKPLDQKVQTEKPPAEQGDKSPETDSGKVSSDAAGETTDKKDAVPDEKALEELEKQIKDLAEDILGLDEEALNRLMAEMGLTIADLLNGENVKALVLKCNGESDAAALLTNESLMDLTAQVTEGIDALASDLAKEPEAAPKLEKNAGLVSAGQSGEDAISKEELRQIVKTALHEAPEQTEAVSSQQAAKPGRAEKETAQANPEQGMSMQGEEETVKITVEQENASGNQSRAGTDGRKETAAGANAGREPEIPMVESFVRNLAGVRTDGSAPAGLQSPELMRDIVNQVVEQVKVVMKPETTTMELSLNPEELGRVKLTVEASSKTGQMTASFTVQTEAAREAIESQLQMLRDSLDKQGIKVDAVEVTVSNFGFQQEQREMTGSDGGKKKTARRINLEELNEESGSLDEEEQLAANIMMQNGNSVDYSA